MTTERELLEWAARAMGVFLTREKMAKASPGFQWCGEDEPYFTEDGAMNGTVFWYTEDGEIGGTERRTWTSLHNSGDCAEMEAALTLSVLWRHNRVVVYATDDGETTELAEELYADHNGDKQAARRWASTRCAAELAPREGV